MKKILGMILFFQMGNINASTENREPNIRVRIGNSLQKVNISGIDLKRYIWPKKSLKTYSGKKSIEFNCVSKNKVERRKPIRLATVRSLTGLVDWDHEKFKGRLHIQTSKALNGCDLINELSLEDYLSTLLPKEMNAKWPIEALKAQAVAARSYAYYKIKTKQTDKTYGFKTYYDLENSEKHQVSGNFHDATKKTVQATKETKGEILALDRHTLSPIFFHSKCGGQTLRPDQVWTNKVPGYRSVICPFCHKHGTKNWIHAVDKEKVSSSLTRALKLYNKDQVSIKQSSLAFTPDLKNNSRLRFYNNKSMKVLKKSRLRSVLGRRVLPSNYFNLKDNGDKIIFSGSGYGHGVGMCQFGAKELALKGYTYKQILAHYFPELQLRKVY